MNPLYLIAYDIAHPRRLGRVHRFLKARALGLQYSVFLAQMPESALPPVIAGLQARMDPRRDDIRIYRLPQPCHPQMLGRQMFPSEVFLGGGYALAALQAQSNPVATAPPEILGSLPAKPLDYNGLPGPAVRSTP